MNKSHDDMREFPPIEYLIPREGTVCRVRILDRDELRLFRTELELLRRIAYAVRFQAPSRPTGIPKTLTPEAYLELDNILHDASHALVETMIVRVDREFKELRKDIVMSVVDKEAKKIAAETTEAGMNTATDPDGSDTADFMDAMSVNEALDVAQAGLAAAVACDPSLPAEFEKPTASESPTPTARADDTIAPIEQARVESVDMDPTVVEAICGDASSEPVDTPVSNNSDASSSQGMETGTEHVENAVAVIEQGIRKLAGMLKGELQEQWTRAHKTLEEVDSSRAKLDDERESSREMLKEISCLRDDARIARDEAVLARQEARRSREATRVAKERAETSAAVAELAADQAAREAKASGDAEAPDGQA